MIPGCEVAGTVVSAPAGSGWTAGDRAAAFVWQGGFAEQVAVPLSSIVPIPDAVSFEFAAAMVVNYHTVHFALARRGSVKAGETVLVMGAAGGIGTAALQVAKGLGARVIAGVSDARRAGIAAAAGASETIVLEPGFATKLREMTNGRGVWMSCSIRSATGCSTKQSEALPPKAGSLSWASPPARSPRSRSTVFC